MRNNLGQFIDGIPNDRRYPVGTVRIRTRHKRPGETRAFVKTAEPNTWVLRARLIWEQANSPIPRGMAIHHVNGDKLDDRLENLELVSKSAHIAAHRQEFDAERIAKSTKARREQRWSTKSDTKRTGRHPKGCQCPIHRST
jgi:hypothetical protein